MKFRGLFINNIKAKDSIYESGYMVYQCLKQSELFEFDYCEISIDQRAIKTGYDFYFFNYHPVTMGWLDTRKLKKELGFVISMILEVAPGDAFVLCPKNDFNLYCALDPTIKQHKNLFPFPRPLEKIDFDLPKVDNEIPVIGSFGFATKGKGFQHVVEAVNKEFDKAIVKINIPYGDFVPESEAYAFKLGNLCKELAKPGIQVEVTHDFMDKQQLILWCVNNTLNCFLYDRNMPGLAATTDQAIVSERPLSISDNDTFRHITAYMKPYPKMSLKAAIDSSRDLVLKMKQDWQPEAFAKKFEIVFQQSFVENTIVDTQNFTQLHIKQNSVSDLILKRLKKYKRKIKNFSFKNLSQIIRNDEII